MAGVPYFSEEAVKGALKYEQLIPEIEETLAKFSSSSQNSSADVDQPLRATASVKKFNGFLSAMPAYVDQSALACKLVSFYPDNASKGLGTISSTILLFDECSGSLKAIMDGELITAMRTAAVSAVATKHLAKEMQTLTVIGSGAQAKSHVQAFLNTFPFTRVNIWNRRKAGAEKLAHCFREIYSKVDFQVCDTVEESVAQADVVVCATFATEPVLGDLPMKPWVHINSIGAPRPSWQELDPALMTSSVVYVDSYTSAQNESGDVILSGATVFAEIGEVVSGRKEALKNQRTIFKSMGMAVEDAVSAQIVYRNLKK